MTSPLHPLDDWLYKYRQLVRQEKDRTVINGEYQELEAELLVWINTEIIGEDVEVPKVGTDGQIMQRVGYNRAKAEQRNKLRGVSDEIPQ